MGLFRRNKNKNKPVIRQLLDLVPHWLLRSCTKTYQTDKGCSKYKTYDQFVALTFGQLNKCQSLNDISAGIGVSEIFINDLGLTQSPARSTMSDGNKNRDWRVFERLYYGLNFLNLSIETRQKGKRKSLQKLFLTPLFKYNVPSKITEGKVVRMVYVMPKFSIGNDRRLIVELNEKNGERDLKLKMSHKYINNPN